MSHQAQGRLRVAAIDFLNPAPLLYNFEHEPAATALAGRYNLRYTSPAQCARQLRTGEADLGLVPIGALPTLPGIRAVPGCAIASLQQVRSIQLVLRRGVSPAGIRSIAADQASRSSAAYVQILLRSTFGTAPAMVQAPAALATMLREHDAALLIGDPALLAVEARDTLGSFADCTWIDVATWWREQTGLPWVAAVWAVRPEALNRCAVTADALTRDLEHSRDDGLAHREQLVAEWTPRIGLAPATIRTYLTDNIHYVLDSDCLRSIACFYQLAARTGVFAPYCLPMLQGRDSAEGICVT